MKRRNSTISGLSLLIMMSFAAGMAGAATIDVTDYASIHDAVAAAADYDTVYFPNGGYQLDSTLDIASEITLSGESESGVTININTGSGWGIRVRADNVTLENFTLQVVSSGTYGGYPIHCSGPAADPVNGIQNLAIQDVTVQGAGAVDMRRSGVDLNGCDGVSLVNVTSTGATYGTGFNLSGCKNVVATGLATAGNAWGSVGVMVSDEMTGGWACDNVTIGASTFGEGVVYIENEYGLESTNIVVTGYEYHVRNSTFREGNGDSDEFTFIEDTLQDAIDRALGWPGHEASSIIYEIANPDQFLVADGMSIQTAIDAADPGATLNILAGTYREQLRVDGKDLALHGTSAATVVVEAPDPADRTPVNVVKWTGAAEDVDAVVMVTGPAIVDIADLTVDGRDTGPNNFYGVYYFDADGAVSDCTITGILYPGGPGAQKVVNVVATHGATGSCDIALSGNTIPGFQKGGILVMGPAAVFDIADNQITNQPTPAVAGNAIQVSYGATGALSGNEVTGVAYEGEDWSATGILLFECGDVSLDGDYVHDCETGVSYNDWRWVHAMPVPVNLTFTNLVLADNEWSLGAQLSGDGSDLNLVVDGGTITGSTGDAIDVYGTDIDPWGGGYYTGWENGDLNVDLGGMTVDGAALDGLWTADLSGNATNVVHQFVVREAAFDNCANAAVNNVLSTAVDARLCYWGDIAGPVVGAKSAGSVVTKRPLAAPAGADLPARGGAVERRTDPAKVQQTVLGDVVFAGWLEDAPANLGARPWTLHTSPPAGGIGAALAVAIDDEDLYATAGTYTESFLMDKKVDLIGAGSGDDPATNTIVGNQNSDVITVQASGHSTADRLLLQDLRVLPDHCYGIEFATGLSQHVMFDNVQVIGHDPVDDTEAETGLKVATAASVDDLVIVDCAFDHCSYGWYFAKHGDWGPGGTNVTNVDVTGTSFSFNQAKGLYVEKLSEATFTACVVHQNGHDAGFWNSDWNAGVDINLKGEETYQTYRFIDCVVTDNGLNAKEGVGLTVKGRGTGDDASYADHPAYVDDVLIQGGTYEGNERGLRFGEPGKNNTTPTNVVVTGATIVDNTGTYAGGDGSAYGGIVNVTTAQDMATCNWWGTIDGPDAPGNPSPNNAVAGDVVYWPWLDGPGGECTLFGPDHVAVSNPATCLTPQNGCAQATVSFNRTNADPLRGLSVTFELSPELTLCTPAPAADIVVLTGAGSLLAGYGNTNTQVVDNGGGSYTVDVAILGDPCGPTTGGDVFTVAVAMADGVTGDATGLITVTDVVVRDCDNVPLPGIPGPVGEVNIDLTAPANATDLAAAQVKTDNDGDGTTKIELSWTAPADPDADFVEIWRKGFGDYPEYDDGAGATPGLPVETASGWVHVDDVDVSETSYTDEPPTRDFWTYAVKVVDACGNVSVVAAEDLTGGTLNYHLGDVAPDGGNNQVGTGDVSVLGAAYGTHDGDNNYNNLVDIGPTADYGTDSLPQTDNAIGFEDLLIMALNYGMVSKDVSPNLLPAAQNLLTVKVDPVDAQSGTVTAQLVLQGNGELQGLSVPLTWNADVVTPVGFAAGDLIAAQGGLGMVLSPAPGTVDAAILGVRDRGICGEGVLATVTFRVVKDGDPEIAAGEIVARDASNEDIQVAAEMAQPALPAVGRSELRANVPNPFNPATAVNFALSRSGPVRVRIYSVQGRLVRTLVDGDMAAGEHSVTWQGRDDAGRTVASGSYIVRLEASDRTQSRRITLLK